MPPDIESCVAWHASGVIVTGSWEGELEFRSAPDYHRTGRLLQLSGGITVTLPPSGVPDDLPDQTRAELVWISQPEPDRFELLP